MVGQRVKLNRAGDTVARDYPARGIKGGVRTVLVYFKLFDSRTESYLMYSFHNPYEIVAVQGSCHKRRWLLSCR